MSETKSATSPAVIVAIVIIIIAVIFFMICLGIVFAAGNKPELSGKRGQLVAGGALLSISIIMSIVIAILTGVLISNRSKGKDARGLAWTVTIMSIITGILLVIGLVVIFVTANQLNATRGDDARSLQAAGALGLIGIVMLFVAFLLFIFNAFKQLPKPERKEYKENLFRTRTRTRTNEMNPLLAPLTAGESSKPFTKPVPSKTVLSGATTSAERAQLIDTLREIGRDV